MMMVFLRIPQPSSNSSKATELHGEVMHRMYKKDSAPFEPLYRYIDMNSSASASDLEKQYGPITRDLLKAITMGRSYYKK